MIRPRISAGTITKGALTSDREDEVSVSKIKGYTDGSRSLASQTTLDSHHHSTIHSISSSSGTGNETGREKEAHDIKSSVVDVSIRPYAVPSNEAIVKIDAGDESSQTQCTEYVDDVYRYLFKLEVFEQSLQLDTLFLSVSILDRFLSSRVISREKLDLLSLGCFYVACKFEETYYPTINQLLRFVPDVGKKEDVLKMERIILNELRYTLGAPTSVVFLKRFAKAAIADSNLGMVVRFLCEFSLMSYSLQTNYPPSLVAAASIANGLRVLHRTPWTATLEHYTGYKHDQLRECMAEMRELVKKAPTMKMQTIFKKYSDARYYKAAITAVQHI